MRSTIFFKGIVASLLMAIGFGVGYQWNRPAELVEVHQFSAANTTQETLRVLCLENEAFQSLSSESNMLPAEPFYQANVLQLNPTAIGDRGVVCEIQGDIFTIHSGGQTTKEPFHKFLLHSVLDGSSEIITEGFARQLVASKAVESMSSNERREAVSVEQPRIVFDGN